ncbi:MULTISPECIES: hypothetical protein, partial [unclassified Microcoleus]|uniref:hypothetical protein n=1 Tax=unclassified Microcoleus TaxID=2642155 RepID=UPI0025FA3DE8
LLQKPGFLIPSAIALDASPSYPKYVAPQKPGFCHNFCIHRNIVTETRFLNPKCDRPGCFSKLSKGREVPLYRRESPLLR